jgi:RNA polymerase sigma-70 factor, ECF subfamily
MRVASEQDLVTKMARGDVAAFESIYHEHQGGIFRFAWHMCGDREAAEEIVQDAFVALLEKPHAFDASRGSLSGYLYGISRNLMRKRLRSEWAEDPLEDAGDVAAFEVDPDETFTVDAVRAAVLSLPPVYREAVALCDLQEASYEEAAAVLECAVGTVRSRLFRGRRLLCSKLTAQKVRLQS